MPQKPITGIYSITDTDGKRYVGASYDVLNRWTQQQQKFDFGVCLFELLEVCDFGQLRDRENYWIDKFNSVEEGYNKCRSAYPLEQYKPPIKEKLSIQRENKPLTAEMMKEIDDFLKEFDDDDIR